MKRQIVTGLIGAASLLAIAATGAYAIGTPCTKGTVGTITAGYIDGGSWGNSCIGSIKLTCNDDTANPVTGTYCVHSGIYPDGVMAAALTASVENRTVSYLIYDDSRFLGGLILNLGINPAE